MLTKRLPGYSHHPPVTAYCVRNKSHGVHLQGYNGQKASFSKRIDVKQVGHALLHLEKYDETYLVSLPFLHIEGLWVGAPFVELNGKSYINSSSGYTAKIDYSGRGWLSGKKNTFAASLYPQGKEKETLYTVDGQWTGEFTIKDVKSKSSIDTWNGKTQKTSRFDVKPIEEQDELESRRAWSKVANALAKGDMNATSNEKSLIENSQRELRKKEQAEGKEWDRVFFSRRDKDEAFVKLGESLGERLEADKTNGVWRYDESKAVAAKSPYRPGVLPKQSKE